MKQKMLQNGTSEPEVTAVSRALSSIYTGVFYIDLLQDRYTIINSPEAVCSMLTDIESAQRAIYHAMQNTVSKDDIFNVLTFVNLKTLPIRMRETKYLHIEYKGMISGWVRGSFIEVERDDDGNVVQVLYTYQVIDEEKRKELEHLRQLKDSYARTEKNMKHANQSLVRDNSVLADDLAYHNNLTNVVMEQLTCGVLVYTIPGRNLLQINQEALRIMGWKTVEEASANMEKNWKNVRLIGGTQETSLLHLRQNKGTVRYQFLIKADTDEEKRILAESKSFAGRNGGSIIVSTLMDITHVTALEKEKNILESKNTLLANENVELQRARDAVYIMMKSGSYLCTYAEDGESLLSIKFSEALRKLYGYTNEEDAPNTWDMWLKGAHPDDRAYVEQQFVSALHDRTGKTKYSVTYRGIKKDGSVRWFQAAGHIIRRKDGSAEYCYGLITDIDEQKKASDMLEEAMKQAQRANKAKTSFLTRMSHDIRTPMNGIVGLLDINEKHADDIALISENRKKAKVAANHLLSLINDVLQLSKLEDSTIELTKTPFDMQELLDDIFTITDMRAKENGITVRRSQDASVAAFSCLWGSPLHIRQIYINLLGNSVKYNKKNGSIICHAYAEKTGPEQIMFTMIIRDTGIGMSEEFQQYLFDPFAREHEMYEGTGLGLSIVKQMVDKMNGTIQVESKLDEGSCFTVKLPFTLASREDVERVKTPEDSGNIAGNILLVEDNELNMDIANILLSDAGATLTMAVNGARAVEIFENNPAGTFDLILMDIMMPEMNGYEATRRIRALERADAKEIPIIAMTANAFAEDVAAAKEAGMNAHLAKPLDTGKMLAVIARYLHI